jgi:S-methylmethionine-dependent homocysteine/selenocysteine methylase
MVCFKILFCLLQIPHVFQSWSIIRFRHGVPDDRKIWSAKALVNPEYHPVLDQVHRSFQRAGSQAITTNSYATVPASGFSLDEISKYAALAGKIARQSVDGNHCLVFGSLAPLVESYRADLIKKHPEGVADYKNICQALDPYVDAYLAETMSCVDESAQAMQAVAESSSRPMLVSYTLTPEGCFRDGKPVVPGLGKLLDLAKAKKVQGTWQMLLKIKVFGYSTFSSSVVVDVSSSSETLDPL